MSAAERKWYKPKKEHEPEPEPEVPLQEVVVPEKKTVRIQQDGILSEDSGSARSLSNASSDTNNWIELSQRLRELREADQSMKQEEQMKVLRERKNRAAEKHHKWRRFWRRFSCLFLGTMFFRHRHRFITLLEVLFPILLSILIFAAFTSGISFRKAYSERNNTETLSRENKQLKFDDVDQGVLAERFRKIFTDKFGRAYIAFAPRTDLTVELMKRVLATLKIDNQNKVLDVERHSSFGAVGVNDYSEIMEHCLLHRKDKVTHETPVGIEFKFDKKTSSYTSLPLKMSFSISTFNPHIADTAGAHPYVIPPRDEHWQPPYIESGFIGLQYAIQEAYISTIHQRMNDKHNAKVAALEKAGKTSETAALQKKKPKDPNTFPELIFKLIYTPNFYDKTVRTLISVVMCTTITVSYMFLSFFIVRQLVVETQSGIKDLLTMHTLPKYYHWIVLYLHSVILRVLTSIGITCSLFIDYGEGPIMRQSEFSLIFVIMMFHLFSLSSFNFFISTVFTSVNFCGVYSVCICFLSYFVPYCLDQAHLISFIPNVILSILFPNWALSNILFDVIDYECDDSGVNWGNMTTTKSKDRISVAIILTILLANSGAYFALAVLRDLLFNRENSGGYTWYRMIQKCCTNRREAKKPKTKAVKAKKLKENLSDTDEEDDDESDYEKPAIYEKHALPKDSAVKIRNLSKMYGRHRLVLDNISIDFAHGEITVLLGHTDSGKSTLIECIAGLVQPSTGRISVNGYDVSRNTSDAMSCMGLCPQEVRSFNLFSVQEHLTLCYQLRGIRHKESLRQATSLMKLLRLEDVKDRVPSALTDDEKRKLGIAMCLVDKPVVILLDEPTFKMEPLARHEIWDILKHLKREGHSIILTTNMMDEAEYLADRIVLLSHGKLICCGTPGFLKEQFDTGYYLKIYPNPVRFNLNTFQKVAMKYFAEPLRDAPKKTVLDEKNFILVLPKHYQKRYADFFDELQMTRHKLGIISYGVQSISLSDVFVKICETVSPDKNAPNVYARKNSKDEWVNTMSSQVPSIPAKEKIPPKFNSQFLALFQKRFHSFTFKYFLQIVWEIIVPTFFVWVVVWHAQIFVQPVSKPVKREFRLETFPKLKAYYRLSGLYIDEMDKGWSKHVPSLLGKYGEKLQAKDYILKTIFSSNRKDHLNKNFHLEKRMIALELRASSGSGSDSEQWVLYYSSGSLHSPALVLNLIGNIKLRAITYNTEHDEKYSMRASNIPFPTQVETPFDLYCDVTCVVFAIIISCCIGFFGSVYAFPRLERLTGMKELQIMSGVPVFTYWLSHYAFDLIISVCLTFVVIACFVVDTNRTFWSSTGISSMGFFLILFLCWSAPPWIYYLTCAVTKKWSGTGFITIFHFIFAILPILILEWAFQNSMDPVVHFFRYLFHLFPPYTLTAAYRVWFDITARRSSCYSVTDDIKRMCQLNDEHKKLYNEQFEMREIFKFVISKDINLAMCCPKICAASKSCFKPPSYFNIKTEQVKQPRLFFCMAALIFQGILYWVLLFLRENNVASRIIQSIIFKFIKHHKDEKSIKKKEMPKDIYIESERVAEIVKYHRENKHLPPETALVCSDITKSYTTRMVLNTITMEVHKGEIVGVLGGGGSGKSTLIQIMAGDVVPTRGSIVIGDYSLRENRVKYLQNIGYCPQTNSMFDNFTGVEMMRLMGKLKGVPGSLLEIHVKKWLQVLGLTELAKDLCRTYSRSMKRLLCGAMALIGGNPILLFDEPTTGIDPLARQRFWSVIKYMATQGHSIVFSSYNVDECAAVCTRIIVLSEGNPQCIGSPAELINRFSRGFSLMIRIRFEVLTPMEIVSATIGRVQDLKKTVEKKFKHATLRDEQDNLLLYFLRDTKLTWGEVFRVAEEIKTLHFEIFEKYFVSQASLEDVFILLTNRYREMDTPRRMEASYPGEISQFEAETAALEEATKGTTF